jgi:hypothetical protein
MTNKLRMTLLIDERSHPELYADLISIDGDRNRTERVRWLAGLGLVLSARTNSTPNRPHQELRHSPQVTVSKEHSVLPVDSHTAENTSHFAHPQTPAAASSGQRNILSRQDVSLLHVDMPPSTAESPNVAPEVRQEAPDDTPAAKAAKLMARAGLFGVPSPAKTPSER